MAKYTKKPKEEKFEPPEVLDVSAERAAQIIEKARIDWKRCNENCAELHKDYIQDKKFVFEGKQWDQNDNESQRKGRPMLVINKSLQFVMQVANNSRQNRPSIRVLPNGEGATQKLAEVRAGIIRAIERNSNAQSARQNALKDAVGAGFGFYRVVTDYAGEDSFDQDIEIKRIMDASVVSWDPDAQEPDYSDSMCYFIQELISKDKFKSIYGDEAAKYLDGVTDFGVFGNNLTPSITEYWYVDLIPDTLFKLIEDPANPEAPKTVYASEKPDMSTVAVDPEDGKPISRPTKRRQVYWCKLAGGKVLQEIEWPGYWIPIIPVLGRETLIEGKRKLNSLIRPAKDSARMYNYARSNMAERLALSSKAPWVVAEESIPPNRQAQWNTSNTKTWGALYYSAYTKDGKPLPAPKRGDPIQVDQGLVAEAATSTQELKETTGMYDSSLGNKSNETSGVAIEARQNQGDTASYDFTDNLSTAIRFEGKIIDDLIPYVYDVERQIRIIGQDDKEEVVWVNKVFNEGGQQYHHDLSVGKFDVAIDVGPSYQTKRQESEAFLQQLGKVSPEVGELTSDLAIQEQDSRFSNVAAKRVRKFLSSKYPNVVEPEKDENGNPVQNDQATPPPELIQAHQMMDQMHNVIDQMQAQLKTLSDKADLEQKKLDLEWYKAETGRLQAEAEAEKDALNPLAAVAQIKAEADIERAHAQAAGQILSSRIQADAQSSPQGAQQPGDGSQPSPAQDQQGPSDASESVQPSGVNPNA